MKKLLNAVGIRDTEEYKFAYQLMTNNLLGVPYQIVERQPDISPHEWIAVFLPLFTEAVDEEEYEIALGFKEAISAFVSKVYGIDVPESWKLTMPPYE